MKDLIKIAVILALVWVGWKCGEPFWDKYWLEKEIEKTATYLTKNSVEQTRALLTDTFKANGIPLTGDDVFVYKNEKNEASISFTYTAEINIFGYVPKVFKFEIKKGQAEVHNRYLN